MKGFKDYLIDKVTQKALSIIPYRFGEIRELIILFLGVARHMTLTKFLNLIIREFERLRKVDLPLGFPFHAVIDIMNICNLKCPYCPTGRNQNSGRIKKIIDSDILNKFIDNLHKYLIVVDLFNWGEPLLHPKINDIVNMLHKKGIFLQISSNLNIHDQQILERLCDAELDLLIISISGITQEIYEKYHQQGDIKLLLDNLRYIINYKNKNKYSKPIIELKYLIFKHNIHQIEYASNLAKEIGVDIFRTYYGGGPEDKIISINEKKNKLQYPDTGKFCSQLWRTIVLNSDGGIAPCCFLYFKKDDFGNYDYSNNLNDIISNPIYITARRLFKSSLMNKLPKDLQHPCLKCIFVHRQPHLTGYLASNPYAKQAHRTGGP